MPRGGDGHGTSFSLPILPSNKSHIYPPLPPISHTYRFDFLFSFVGPRGGVAPSTIPCIPRIRRQLSRCRGRSRGGRRGDSGRKMRSRLASAAPWMAHRLPMDVLDAGRPLAMVDRSAGRAATSPISSYRRPEWMTLGIRGTGRSWERGTEWMLRVCQ